VNQLLDNSATDVRPCTSTVEELAHQLLAGHPHFHGRAGNFEYEYRHDVLIVRGCVPSFYLKQVLQTVLKEVEGVACIDNRVDVISSEGTSSARLRSHLSAG
jgi:hypothetical protein